MTSQKAIEALIAEIDGVLASGGSRLPMFAPGDVAGQRRVLQRVRSYLVSLQQQQEVEQPKAVESPPQEAAHAIAKAVVKEMTELRAGLMQPLQADLQALRQQRESLVKEIRVLETQRQHYQTLAQQQATQQQIISEFLQVLTNRLQESLTHQITQTLANLELKYTSQEETFLAMGEARRVLALESGEDEEKIHHIASPLEEPLHPRDRLEHLRQIERESDQLLMRLDSTIRLVLESLQNNVLGYEESLSQGVAKMHSLGQQGELLFTALVNHLASQLGREASTMVHSSQNRDAIATVSTALAATTEATTISADRENLPLPKGSPTQEVSTQGQFAFPGMELQVDDAQAIASPHSQENSPIHHFDEAPLEIASSKIRVDSTSPQESEQPLVREAPLKQVDSSAIAPMHPENWEIVELDLDALGLEPINVDEIDTILQLDVDSITPASALDSNSAPASPKAANKPIVRGEISSVDTNSSSSFLTPSSTPPEPFNQPYEDDFDSWLIDSSLDLSSDGENSELDDLYESLFGAGAESEQDTSEASRSNRSESLKSSENSKLSPDMILDNSKLSDSSQFEEALFGGLEDLATHSAAGRSPREDTNQLADSWEEVLFFEDAPEDVELHLNLELEAANQEGEIVASDEESHNLKSKDFTQKIVTLRTAENSFTPEIINTPLSEISNLQPESIETIALLTDLFKEKPFTKGSANTAVIQQKKEGESKQKQKGDKENLQLHSPHKSPTSIPNQHNAAPQETQSKKPDRSNGSSMQVVEDSYIQARPEENLLTAQELKSDREIEFLLDEDILEQLSEDLSSFEASENEDFQNQGNSKAGEQVNLVATQFIAPEAGKQARNINSEDSYKKDITIQNSQFETADIKGDNISSTSAPLAPIDLDGKQELSTPDVPAIGQKLSAGDSQTKDADAADFSLESAIASSSDISSVELDWDSDLDLLEAMNLELDTNADNQDDDFTNWTLDANIAPTYSEWELLFPNSEEFTDFDQTDDKKQ